MSSLFQRVVVAGAVLSTGACTNPLSGSDCLLIGVAGINVTVVDANTNRAPTSAPTLRIEDGTFVEEYATPIPRSDPPAFSGAVERPGTYRITVNATGYRNFAVDGIAVTRSGKCAYLQGRKLDVKLVPNQG